jgi:hypothetical protein
MPDTAKQSIIKPRVSVCDREICKQIWKHKLILFFFQISVLKFEEKKISTNTKILTPKS